MIISLNRGRTSKCYKNCSYYSGHYLGLSYHPLSHHIPPTSLFLKGPCNVDSVSKVPHHTVAMSCQGRTACVHARPDDQQLCVYRVMHLSELGRCVWMAVMKYISWLRYGFLPSLQNRELEHRQKDHLGGPTTNWKTAWLHSSSPLPSQKRKFSRISQVYHLGFYR